MIRKIALIFILLAHSVFSQAPDTLWTKLIGGPHIDLLGSAVLRDSTLLIVGGTQIDSGGPTKATVFKYSTDGELQAQKVLDYCGIGYNVALSGNSNYAVIGAPSQGQFNTKILVLDEYLDTVFTFDTTQVLYWPHTFFQDSENNFIIVRSSQETFLYKTDSSGSKLWTIYSLHYPGADLESVAYDGMETPDSNYLFVGYAVFNNKSKIWLVKMSRDGDILWNKIFGNLGNSNMRGRAFVKTHDNNIMVLGNLEGQIFVTKFNWDGDSLWTKFIPNLGQEYGYDIIKTFDDGFAISGYSQVQVGSQQKLLVVKIDSMGNLLWKKIIDSERSLTGEKIFQIQDSSYIILGYSQLWPVIDLFMVGLSNKPVLIPPQLSSVPNGSINQPLDVQLSWLLVSDAIDYRFQLSTDSVFSTIFIDQANLSDTFYNVSSLDFLTTYYWRVNSRFPTGTSEWSEVWSFTTVLTPEPPQLVTPVNSSINIPLSTTLSWEPVALSMSYRLQISADSLFSNYVINDSNITSTSKTVNLPASNQKYFWRVQSKNVGGYSIFSEEWNFISLLPAPLLSNIEARNKAIEIEWNPPSFANIQLTNVYRDTTPNPSNFIASVPVGTSSFLDTGLTNSTIYYYRIKSVSTYGVESDFSNQLYAAPFNSPPIATALDDVFLPNEGRVLTKQLSFSSSGSFDPDGFIDSIKWFVDNVFISQGTDFTYDFPQGSNFVSLVVIDNQGGSDTSTAVVTRSMFRNIVNGQVIAGLSLIGENIIYAIVNNDAIYKMDTDGNVNYTLAVGGNLLAASSIANDSTVYIGSTDNNIYAFSKNGTSLWVRALGGAVTTTPTIDILNNRVYVGVSNRNFQFIDRESGNVLGNYFSDASINTSAVITADNKLFFSTVKGTMYGFDLGNITFPNVTPTWTIISTDTISSSPAIDEEGFFYVGTKNGLLKKISMEAGQQGTVVWQANLGGEIIASPVIDASGYIYVGSSNSDFFCVDRTDGYIKWSFTFSGQIKTAAAISDESRIYFGTENGFIYCVDTTGTTLWQYKDSTSICNSLLYSDGVLYLGTYGGRLVALYDYDVTNRTVVAVKNIWSTFQGNNQRTGEQADRITDIKSEESGLPVSYQLSQNYPNPFNPSTKIKFDLPQNSIVDLKIYNILGQLIITLVNEEKPAGFYEVDFNAADLPSGVYLYRIQAGDHVQTRKMLLLK